MEVMLTTEPKPLSSRYEVAWSPGGVETELGRSPQLPGPSSLPMATRRHSSERNEPDTTRIKLVHYRERREVTAESDEWVSAHFGAYRARVHGFRLYRLPTLDLCGLGTRKPRTLTRSHGNFPAVYSGSQVSHDQLLSKCRVATGLLADHAAPLSTTG
jgi:hypothetical protein